jgi:glycosidase
MPKAIGPRHLPLALLLAAVAACSKGGASSSAPLLHVPSPAWEEQVIYFVMTDRFANGDRSNDDQGKGEFDPTSNDKYSGGDLQGIIDRLDYIQGLGATAVWITPPVANQWWDPLQQSGGYHGYWARDLKQVDEHLGTLATYQRLSDALHRRGMYLIQDVVPNHMGNFFTYATTCGAGLQSCYDPSDVAVGLVQNAGAVPTVRPTQPPFDLDDPSDPVQRARAIYHWTPVLADYNDPVQEKTYQLSDLDDLNTENPEVRTALRDAYGSWIRQVGVDAFRVDTVKYVDHAFWNDFFQSTDAAAPGMLAVARATGRERFHAFGEVFETSAPLEDSADRKLASYLGTPGAPELPALLQFPLYQEIGRVFGSGAPTAYMAYRLGRFMDPALYPNPGLMPTFVDNHDVQRFLAVGPGTGLVQALSLIFTVPGIPTVYYGTEQLFTETRQAMFKGGFHSTIDQFEPRAAFYQRIKALSALRRAHPVFTRGGLDVRYDSPSGAGPLAYRRTLGSETALVLMNTADEPVLVSQLDTGLPAGTVLEVLRAEQFLAPPATVPVGLAGRLTTVLPPRAVLIVRATSQLVTPPTPGVAIAEQTLVEGQTFTTDVTLRGTVSPAATRLRLVVDGYVDQALPVTVAADGSWSAVLPVSGYPEGPLPHSLAILAPDSGVATPSHRFLSDVVFVGNSYPHADPVGDDTGPSGTYTYPLATAIAGHQMDLTGVTLQVGTASPILKIQLTMRDWSRLWNPPLGFDRVAFSLFFDLPGRTGLVALPRLNAVAPAAFTWSYDHFAYGWNNVMYDTTGADADTYGSTIVSPGLLADPANKTVTFSYDRRRLGLASWSGVKVYVTTWDFDGINGVFRPLAKDAGDWTMGGAPTWDPVTFLSTEPRIMDDAGPFTIP